MRIPVEVRKMRQEYKHKGKNAVQCVIFMELVTIIHDSLLAMNFSTQS